MELTMNFIHAILRIWHSKIHVRFIIKILRLIKPDRNKLREQKNNSVSSGLIKRREISQGTSGGLLITRQQPNNKNLSKCSYLKVS
jgi:hypothetical protein